MSTDRGEIAGYLPGMTPPAPSGGVRQAYEKTINRMLEQDVLDDSYAGLCANLLRLAEIIDTERKAYAVATATREAVEIMKLLHEHAASKGDDAFQLLVAELTDK